MMQKLKEKLSSIKKLPVFLTIGIIVFLIAGVWIGTTLATNAAETTANLSVAKHEDAVTEDDTPEVYEEVIYFNTRNVLSDDFVLDLMKKNGISQADIDAMNLPFDLSDMSWFFDLNEEDKAALLNGDFSSLLDFFNINRDDLAESGIWPFTLDDLPFELPDLSSYEDMTREEFIALFWSAFEPFYADLPFELPDFSTYEGMTQDEIIASLKVDLLPMLEYLVENGWITQEHVDAILAFNITFELPSISRYFDMPEDEMIDAICDDVRFIIDGLLSDGTITQEQADWFTDWLIG